jgi:hypothetical protein
VPEVFLESAQKVSSTSLASKPKKISKVMLGNPDPQPRDEFLAENLQSGSGESHKDASHPSTQLLGNSNTGHVFVVKIINLSKE